MTYKNDINLPELPVPTHTAGYLRESPKLYDEVVLLEYARAAVLADRERRDTIEQQIQRAAQHLPEGWRIAVEAEKDAGWVSLYTPDGVLVEINADGSPAEHIEQAINAAMAREAQQ